MFTKKTIKQILLLSIIIPIILKVVYDPSIISEKTALIFTLLSPIIWAFSIAYLLNPIMNFLQRKCKLNRNISIFIIYLFVIGFITVLITVVSPRIINSINNLVQDAPNYVKAFQKWINTYVMKSKLLQLGAPYIKENINAIVDKSVVFLNLTSASLFTKALHITSNLISAVLGLVISIYMLKDKESFIKGSKRLLYSLFENKKAEFLIDLGKSANKMFSQFIIGKIIDSLIVGIICFIGLFLFKVKYAGLISIILGITNMIPYFGPILGMIPAFLITSFYSPIKAIWVLVFLIILKEFDGLYLGPKILGDKVGLSPFWIIIAIIIGGESFGIAGMFMAVPIMGLIKIQLDRFITTRLDKKNM